MSLKLVSLTGADDNVSPADLVIISAKYQSVPPEWAILYFPEKQGTQRNPSAPWREEFLAQPLPFTAVHLCGSQVFRDILDPNTAPAIVADLRRYGRIQLNINARRPEFSDDEVLTVYWTLFDAGIRLILQYHDGSKSIIERFLMDLSPEEVSRVDILFDGSKGKGQRPGSWPSLLEIGPREPCCGYAGGLGPEVVSTELMKITVAAVPSSRPFWIDMESGIRTDNEFDLVKVDSVLQQVESAVQNLQPATPLYGQVQA